MKMKQERIFKSGNSQAMSLSKQTANLIGLEIGDKVNVEPYQGGLLITKQQTSIGERIRQFYENGGKYNEPEIDFGESKGREI